jgi:hypothetical protein
MSGKTIWGASNGSASCRCQSSKSSNSCPGKLGRQGNRVVKRKAAPFQVNLTLFGFPEVVNPRPEGRDPGGSRRSWKEAFFWWVRELLWPGPGSKPEPGAFCWL